ncbi:MAG: hypothetical protein PHC88_07840 [Terrimicrobiaceae bacterium]|nr:hypothetical protein [Terrimicrobiaceae bacterium]
MAFRHAHRFFHIDIRHRDKSTTSNPPEHSGVTLSHHSAPDDTQSNLRGVVKVPFYMVEHGMRFSFMLV